MGAETRPHQKTHVNGVDLFRQIRGKAGEGEPEDPILVGLGLALAIRMKTRTDPKTYADQVFTLINDCQGEGEDLIEYGRLTELGFANHSNEVYEQFLGAAHKWAEKVCGPIFADQVGVAYMEFAELIGTYPAAPEQPASS
jgi:hypothetical protein